MNKQEWPNTPDTTLLLHNDHKDSVSGTETFSLPIDTQHTSLSSDTAIIDLFATPTHQLITHTSDSTTMMRDGLQAEPMAQTIANNQWVILLLFASFFFFAISYRRGAKYLQHLFSSLFMVHTRGNLFDETTINENQLKLSLILLTFVTEGIALYHLLVGNTMPQGELIFPLIVGSIIICALYYLAQRILYNVLGNIFSTRQQTDAFIDSFNTINLFIGLFLTPLILAMIFLPATTQIGVLLCIVFYILSRLIIIYKGIRFFLPHIYASLYLILYLCALEISPIFLMGKWLPQLYDFIELIFIKP